MAACSTRALVVCPGPSLPARGLQDTCAAHSPFARHRNADAEVLVGTIATACLGRRGSAGIQGREVGEVGKSGWGGQRRRSNNESDHSIREK
jgi:hypothetical protein